MDRRTIIFVFLLTVSGHLFSQTAVNENKQAINTYGGVWQLGINLGPDFFSGDLSNYSKTPFDNVSFAGSVSFGRQFTNVVGLRLQFLVGGLRGTKHYMSGNQNYNQSFSGINFDFNSNITINFSNLFSPYKPSRRFFVYGTIGIGIAGWRTQRVSPSIEGVTPTETPIQWRSGGFLPSGLGLLYKIGKNVNLNLEYTFRMVFSDMVDQTVGGFKYDVYNYLALGVSINLGHHGKKSLKVLDYAYPVAVPMISNPVQNDSVYPTISKPFTDVVPGDFIYSVQICAFSQHQYTTKWVRKHYHIAQPVRMEKDGNLERFLVGNYKEIEYARELCQALIKQGVHDAFVVAYKNGIRDHTITP